ncbi:putative DYW domain-containing protein [Rosa chinensis]|uniref:Putative DYW domain-containing protein n=1 Tax=Rosa chinensis TaxID=74649 RepID=A0A2P6SCQ1_ROSCH|nr:putative DYW domain-containing protein [Rosa chinensis]
MQPGLVEEGLNLFDELLRDGSIQVREEHYTCLVDLCGRAGRLKEAFGILEKLATNPSASKWGALLAGFIDHHNMDTGKLAAEKLLKEGPDDAGRYSLLWNFFARSGNWREAAKMRIKMKEKGFKKQPGCSWIEVGNMVHVFVVGDKSHCQSQLIYSALYDLHKQMKKIGYIPSNDLNVHEDFSITGILTWDIFRLI